MIAETRQPMYFGVAPEPGPLPLGILPRAGLGGANGLFQRDLSVYILDCLLIAKRFEGLFAACDAERQQGAHFLDQAPGEHGADPLVQPCKESGALRVQANFENPEARQGIGRFRAGKRSSRQKPDLERPHHLLNIARMDVPGRVRLQPGEHPVQRTGPMPLACLQTCPDGVVARGQLGEAVKQRAEIESRASHDDREVVPGRDFGDGLARQPGIVARGVTIRRLQHVEKMVRDFSPQSGWRLGCAHFEASIQLQGVAIDNFPAERRGQVER